MARNMHKFEELTPYEFDREKEKASIIYVAAGPMEYHEEFNALGIDPCKAYAWCLAAAEITGGIVYPMLPVAPSGAYPSSTKAQLQERMKSVKFGEYTRTPLLYPSVMTGAEVCKALYLELLETFVLDAGMNSAKTSDFLEVRTNTVQYRLKKINEILGAEITGNRVIPGLTVALALRRMENGNNR